MPNVLNPDCLNQRVLGLEIGLKWWEKVREVLNIESYNTCFVFDDISQKDKNTYINSLLVGLVSLALFIFLIVVVMSL